MLCQVPPLFASPNCINPASRTCRHVRPSWWAFQRLQQGCQHHKLPSLRCNWRRLPHRTTLTRLRLSGMATTTSWLYCMAAASAAAMAVKPHAVHEKHLGLIQSPAAAGEQAVSYCNASLSTTCVLMTRCSSGIALSLGIHWLSSLLLNQT